MYDFRRDDLREVRRSRKRMSETELKEMLERHRSWLFDKESPAERAVFQGLIFLKYQQFRLDGKRGGGVDLQGANLHGAQIERCDFSVAYLRGAHMAQVAIELSIFVWARLKGVNANNISIHNSDISSAYLQKSNFRLATIENCRLNGSNFDKASLNEASITNSGIVGVSLKGAGLVGSKLSGLEITNTKLQGAKFEGARIDSCAFIASKLGSAQFNNASIGRSSFLDCDLDAADFSNSILVNLNFENTSLKGARFTGCRFTDVLFHETDLTDIEIEDELVELIPIELRKKYGGTFRIRSTEVTLSSIIRSIQFKPEHRQAGIGILSYFSEVLENRYPERNVRFRIEQDHTHVTLVIETPDGDLIEHIEKTLEEYGMVVRGEMDVSIITSDKLAQLELRNELRIAELRIESKEELLAHKEREIAGLYRILSDSLKSKNIEQTIRVVANSSKDRYTHDIGDTNMGDTYNVQQAASVGPNSASNNIQMYQLMANGELPDETRDHLIDELKKLHSAMLRELDVGRNSLDVENIVLAKGSLEQGDSNRTLEYLKSAGNWAQSVASKSGVNLVTALFKNIFGV